MSRKYAPQHHDAVAIAVHWIMALALLGMLVSGFRAAGLEDTAAKLAMLRIHATVGLAVVALAITRILWWVTIDRKPPYTAGQPRWQRIAIVSFHTLLYCAILLMAGSGIAMIAMSGTGDIIWGKSMGNLPDFTQFPPRDLHIGGAFLLIILFLFRIILFLFRIVAAIYHQFVLHGPGTGPHDRRQDLKHI